VVGGRSAALAGCLRMLLARFGGWLVGAAGRLARRLGTRFGRLFDKTRRCYRHLEERLNGEEEPCQVGLLWLMAYIARGLGMFPEAGGDFCRLVYAVDAWRRGKADPGLCLPAYISCMLGEVKLEVLAPDNTPHARVAATVGGEQGECGLPPSCRLAEKAQSTRRDLPATSICPTCGRKRVESSRPTGRG